MHVDDVLGAVWLPQDGRVIPGETAIALAKGAAVCEHTAVEALLQDADRRRVIGVRTPHGDLHAEIVILTGGMWTRQLGLGIGVNIPLYPVEHHYLISEPIAGVDRHFPCARDPNAAIFFRTLDDGSIKLGAFQKRSQPWMVERIPADFAHALLEADWERFAEPLAAGRHRLPALQHAHFPTFVNGPESFTPDNHFLMGPPPGYDGLFVLAGFNSTGIAYDGGADKYTAEWLETGSPTMDLWSVDLRRFHPMHNDRAFLRARVEETLGLHYQLAWPNREFETARSLRWTPLAEPLRARNACFGSSMGWERANWFAPKGEEARVEYRFGRQNWAPHVEAKVAACREDVAVFDQSTFTKFLLRGPGALPLLQRLCRADVDVEIGRCVYTGLFNERGTYESDVTLVRLRADEFYYVSSTSQAIRDQDWIERQMAMNGDSDIQKVDVTAALGVVSVMGPRSRDLLQPLSDGSLSNASFPFGAAQERVIAVCRVRALRMSYVGELGWELHAPFDTLPVLYESLMEAGASLGVRPAGHYAIQAMRLEKAYRAWGHELTTDDTSLEAGLAFAVDWEKDFLGKKALVNQRKTGIRRRLVSLTVADPDAALWGSEPVVQDGHVIGHTTSAFLSPTLGGSVAFAYIPDEEDPLARIRQGGFAIRVNGQDFPAKAHLKTPYDPERLKMRG